jgi:hypothetical protein
MLFFKSLYVTCIEMMYLPLLLVLLVLTVSLVSQ